MAPNTVSVPTGVLLETDDEVNVKAIPKTLQEPDDRKLQLVWRNVVLFAYLHIAALYGCYLAFSSAHIYTSLFCKF